MCVFRSGASACARRRRRLSRGDGFGVEASCGENHAPMVFTKGGAAWSGISRADGSAVLGCWSPSRVHGQREAADEASRRRVRTVSRPPDCGRSEWSGQGRHHRTPELFQYKYNKHKMSI